MRVTHVPDRSASSFDAARMRAFLRHCGLALLLGAILLIAVNVLVAPS